MVAWWCEAGETSQGNLHDPAGECPAHLPRVGVLDRRTQMRAGLLVRRRVGHVKMQQSNVDFVEGFPPPRTSRSCCSAKAALASMSSPVSAMVIVLRKSPTSFNATLSVSGGGLPLVLLIATRSSACCVSRMVSKWVTTSGPR